MMKRFLRAAAVAIALIITMWLLLRVPERGEVAEWIRAQPLREGAVFDFSRVGEFEWTRLCTIGAYTYDQQIDKLLGFDWRGPENNVQDGHSLFIFVNDTAGFLERRAVGYALLTTDPRVTENACYARDGAVFRIMDREYQDLVPVDSSSASHRPQR